MAPQRATRLLSNGVHSWDIEEQRYEVCNSDAELVHMSMLQDLSTSCKRAVQLAPVSHLPNELLVAIFRYGLGPPQRCDSLPFELAVSGVCKAWRTAALTTPDLWTRVFITAKTPIDHIIVYGTRSAMHPLDVEFCHWPTPKRRHKYFSREVFLGAILTRVRMLVHRFRRFAIWNVSDTAFLTILSGLVGVDAPMLRYVSLKGNPSVYTTYFAGVRLWSSFPFLTRNAPAMSGLEIMHVPIESFSRAELYAAGLASLVLKAAEDNTIPTSSLPAYLITFEDLILLLRATTTLTHLALYGPVIDYDDDLFIESPDSRVELRSLRTLIIHCQEPGFRYRSTFLSAITAPKLARLDIPLHDDVEDEFLEDLTGYLFDNQGFPKFPSVQRLYLHDSVVKWRLPTRSFVRAFPQVEDVVLGGNDVWKFVATLRGFVRYESVPATGQLPPEAWSHVRKLTLKDVPLHSWKGCVRGLVKWLAAERPYQAGPVVVRVEGSIPSDKTSWFLKHLERLRSYSVIEYAVFVSERRKALLIFLDCDHRTSGSCDRGSPTYDNYGATYKTTHVVLVFLSRRKDKMLNMTLILTSSEPVPTGQMAPIALLPNEILIAIFKHGLNELPESARSPSFRKITASVCKAWHDVVLRSPELWTRVFVTLTTPVEHLQTCIERSGSLQLDLDICHFVFDPLNCPSCPERFLIAVLDLIRCHSHRLRSLTLWNIPDVAVDMIWKRFRNIRGPVLTDISVKNRPHSHVRLPTVPLFPFLDGHTPKLTNMEIDFPFMIHNVDVKLFNLPVLTYLTLRTRECPLIGYSLPPYLIEFSTFCALLRTTPNLAHLALYGPVIEPDEDFPNRPPPVTLPALKTLIIHRREPGVRYHAEFLSVLTAPHLAHLELPWHDELRVELPRQDCTGYLFGAEGAPRFPLVRRLCLHDSAVEWKLPAVSFIRAFPLVEDVMLGGTDVETFAATLRRSAVVVAKPKFVDYGAGPVAWPCVRKLTLRSVHMHSWKRCAAFLCEWLAARGCCDKGCVRVEVERCSVPPARLRAFMKCLDRLRPYAQVAYRDVF